LRRHVVKNEGVMSAKREWCGLFSSLEMPRIAVDGSEEFE
jgi:hypothetical protein